MSALHNNQKAHLAQLARRAFNLVSAKLRGHSQVFIQTGTLQGDLNRLALDGGSAAFETWRHEQVRLAVGKAGLRCCDQLDYKRVEAHFLSLMGQDGKALNSHLRAESEPRRQAMAVLVEACRRWGFHISYAEQLSRRIHRVTLDEATVQVIWKLVYTINNRGRAKRDSTTKAQRHQGADARSSEILV